MGFPIEMIAAVRAHATFNENVLTMIMAPWCAGIDQDVGRQILEGQYVSRTKA